MEAVVAIPAESDGHEAKCRKAAELNNSRPLDVHRWSDYPEVGAAVEAISREISAATPGFKVNDRQLRVLVCDLYAVWKEDPAKYIAISRSNGAYRRGSRYNKLHISKKVVDLADLLIDLGYAEGVPGHYGRAGGSSHMSRLRATARLIELCEPDNGIDGEMISHHPDTECIVVRDWDEKKRRQTDIEYEDCPETDRMRSQLVGYNNLIRGASITLDNLPPGTVVPSINPHQKFTRRIFSNGSLDDGGRFYGPWWQTMPKDIRPGISINGSQTIELDFVGLHLHLLYAKNGLDYQAVDGKDPYALPGFEESARARAVLKVILLTAINAGGRDEAIKAVKWHISRNPTEFGWVKAEGIDIGDLVGQFVARHNPIKGYFFSGIGTGLQRIDSDIAACVLEEMAAKWIPCLCIHDSFIVQMEFEADLAEAMRNAYTTVVRDLKDESGIAYPDVSPPPIRATKGIPTNRGLDTASLAKQGKPTTDPREYYKPALFIGNKKTRDTRVKLEMKSLWLVMRNLIKHKDRRDIG
jgi:hypothetical protein